MDIKEKFTNKQTAASGIEKTDHGKNLQQEERKKTQSKNDNVKPR